MKKKIINFILLILLIASIVGVIYFYNNKLISYCIVSFAISIFAFIVLITSISLGKNKEEKYERELKNILKIYNAILVESNNYPKIKDKNIIEVNRFEDLVDAQLEIRKPIYYVKKIDSCCFLLLDSGEALVFIMRKNDNVKCSIDYDLKDYYLKNKNDKQKNKFGDVFDDIDKTTIFRLTNTRSFRISPYKKKKNKKDNDWDEELI